VVDLFAKNLHAENVYADHGYFGDLTASSKLTAGQELCVGLTCITESQLKALLSGSGATSQTAAAASASGSGETNAPSGSSMPIGEKNMDAASSTPRLPDQQATTSPPTSSASSTLAVIESEAPPGSLSEPF
jgi:hypothetical protein